MSAKTHHAPHAAHNDYQHRQAFQRAHTSLGGVAGHLLKTAGILAPLIITEFVKDFEKQRKAIRLTSIGTAMLVEGLWAGRVMKERRACAEGREHDMDVQDALSAALASGGMTP